MARISEDVLEVGRDRIRAGDLDGFIAWSRTTSCSPDESVIRSTFGRCFKARNVDAALRMFDNVWGTWDPVEEFAKKLSVLAVRLFVFLALLGGVVALFKVVLGG